MDDRQIRAYLRGATRDRVLSGWYPYDRGGQRYWVISPFVGKLENLDAAGVIDYCRMLEQARVDPMYRTS